MDGVLLNIPLDGFERVFDSSLVLALDNFVLPVQAQKKEEEKVWTPVLALISDFLHLA